MPLGGGGRTTALILQMLLFLPSFCELLSPLPRKLIRASRFVSELVWEGDFDGRFGDLGHAIETFERHNEEVKRRVPPGSQQDEG